MLGGAVMAIATTAIITPAKGGADGVSPKLLALIAECERQWAQSSAHNRKHDSLFRAWHSGGRRDAAIKSLLDAALKREAELDNVALAAEAAVEEYPARNAADLCAKIEYLVPRGWLDCENARVNIVADARRLAGKEA